MGSRGYQTRCIGGRKGTEMRLVTSWGGGGGVSNVKKGWSSRVCKEYLASYHLFCHDFAGHLCTSVLSHVM